MEMSPPARPAVRGRSATVPGRGAAQPTSSGRRPTPFGPEAGVATVADAAASGPTAELDLSALASALATSDPSGRRHPIGLRRILIGDDALTSLPGVVAELKQVGPVVMLTDPTPMNRRGEDLKPAVLRLLAGTFPCRWEIVRGSAAQLHAEEGSIAEAQTLVAGAGCVVVVGSGTITDIGKEATRRAGGIPLVAVQTAVSVNAFSDDMAVLLIDGVKRTVPSRWPDALVVDLSVIADAPVEMNRAGFGELASMYTAPADWYLAGAAGMDDGWLGAPVELARREAEALLAAAVRIHDRERDALALLVRAMTMSGIALGIAGKTAPLSGSEHLISHMLDMDAAATGREAAFHGAQVGVGSILMAIVWRETLARWYAGGFEIGRLYPSATDLEPQVRAAFSRLDPSGRAADECWRDYSRKLDRWHAARPRFEAFVRDWPRHRAALGSLVADPATLAAAIERSGAPARFSQLRPAVSPDVARWALRHCHLMRDRFTVMDLRFFAGSWGDEDVESALGVAAGLGAGL